MILILVAVLLPLAALARGADGAHSDAMDGFGPGEDELGPRPGHRIRRYGKAMERVFDILLSHGPTYAFDVVRKSGHPEGSVYRAVGRMRLAGILEMVEDITDDKPEIIDGRSHTRVLYRLTTYGADQGELLLRRRGLWSDDIHKHGRRRHRAAAAVGRDTAPADNPARATPQLMGGVTENLKQPSS